MKLTTVTLYDVKDLGEVSGVCIYGIGLFSALCYLLCSIIGKNSIFVGRKLERAKDKAVKEMTFYAQELGADGVMNLTYQLSGLSVMVYGTAFQYLDSDVQEPTLDTEAAPAEEAAEETAE